MASATHRPALDPGVAIARLAHPRVTWRDYLTLTKPRVMSLLLLTTVAAMFAAADGPPSLQALWAQFGLAYLICAAVLGGWLPALALRVPRTPSRCAAARLFHFSLLYLTLLFAALAITATIS